MQKIVIKSNIKNRLRLKSKLFTPQNFITIKESLVDNIISIRLNELCFSIIITYDDRKVDIKTILDKIYSVTPLTSKAKIGKEICSCKRCDIIKPNPQSLKTKIKKFTALSIVAVYVFVKEHILATAFSPVFGLGLTVLSLYMAKPLIDEAINDIKNRNFTLESFMAFSLLLAIFGGEITAAFEVIYILTGSRLFEEYTANLSRAEIKNLIKMDVTKLYVLRGDIEIEIDLEDVRSGDTAVFVGGEKICVDGVIIKGEALINEALINGRSRSTLKKSGDKVFANTTIEQGRIFVKVNAVGSETYIARVISDVEKSLSIKSKSEVMADVLAKKVLKIGSAMTAFTLLLTRSFTNAFSVMIVMSCPCATILAASSAVSSAIAYAARNGILIKGGEYLEKVSSASVFCFDKTGTLTTGKPVVKDYKTLIDEREFLEILVNLEHKNTHPIAKAITKFCNDKGIFANSNSHAKNEVGLGVSSNHNGSTYLLGNHKFMINNGIKVTKKENNAYTNIYLAKDSKLIGSISLTHDIRPYSLEMLKELKNRGVKKIVLLTGDDELVSKEFASGFEFDEIYYDLMPNEKADIVEKLSKHASVVMIGDGVNDTLAMSKADVSISFASGGSKAAVEVSNIAITKSDPRDIIKLYDMSKFTLKIANQNYQIGTSTNIFGSFLAMFGLIGPAGAGLIHLVHTSAILLNSNRIK
ncbi:heavy metal translocating P-type ATPase [Campylobacter corcagiensis]|uniref:P-type Zn(2+) transporter n=1 Tax=Campylobacter corcagiensis TaxID=1448857 RepID=A0A7M1LI70_9BACT|nr:heavy metal translocating P-type ATPase [Campylobacter corcagiensis]QKF64644.1 heavy metal translocating P-type ATPase [Campylobacter corcagiensis]QOQ87185.1 cadmium-translocating P-type ATPase [Campylobacter corcagiensis]